MKNIILLSLIMVLIGCSDKPKETVIKQPQYIRTDGWLSVNEDWKEVKKWEKDGVIYYRHEKILPNGDIEVRYFKLIMDKHRSEIISKNEKVD